MDKQSTERHSQADTRRPHAQHDPGRLHLRRLALILAIALLLRTSTLGLKSLWLDEAFSVITSQKVEAANPTNIVDAGHPTLYFTLLHYWLPLAGDGEGAVRLPSALASWLSLPLFYALARRLVGSRVALLGVALLAFSPLDIWYAQEARMNIFIAPLGLLLALGLVWDRWPAVFLVFVGLGAGLYMDYLMLPLWVGLSAVWLAAWWRQGRSPVPLLSWLLGSAAAWWLYRPLWDTLLVLLERLGNIFIFAQLSDRLGLPRLGSTSLLFVLGAAGALLLVGALIAFARLQRQGPPPWVGAIVIGGFVLFTLFVPVPRLYSIKRVAVTGWPYVIILVAWLVEQSSVRERLGRSLLALSLAVSLFAILFVPKDDWRGAVAHLNAQPKAASNLVWLDPSWNYFPYRYYDPEQPAASGSLEDLREAAANSDEVWAIVERYPGRPIPAVPSEAWLNEHFRLVDATPFYRLEVRHYRAAR